MKSEIFDHRTFLDTFMKTAQYLANLTTHEDIWSHIAEVMVRFYGADMAGFGKRRSDGKIALHHLTLPDGINQECLSSKEIEELIGEVLESGFLTWRVIAFGDSYAITFLPVTTGNETTDVMLIGHATNVPISRDLLNVYLAIAGLTGSTLAKLTSERRTLANNELLRLLADASDRQEYLDGVVALVRQWSGCECVGIRILDSEGNLPYQSHVGFHHGFCEKENWLSISRDNCACTRVVRGSPGPQDAGLMSRRGSFLVTDSENLLAGLPKDTPKGFRGVCFHEGFRSIAVVPLCNDGKVVGAVHLADKRAGMVSETEVAFIEELSNLIGEGINRFSIRDALKRHYATQEVINLLQGLSFMDIDLEVLLTQALDSVLSNPLLSFEPAGVIFLLEKGSDKLLLKAQIGLDETTIYNCAEVPVGECLCGEVAQNGSRRFTACRASDLRALHRGIAPHGHYCVPIKLADEVLGVLNIFVKEDHKSDEKEEQFLTIVANTLAGIIHRRQLERMLKESERRFRAIFDQAFEFTGLLRPDGTLLEVNQTALDFVGLERSQVVNRSYWETEWWGAADARNQVKQAIARAAGGEFVRFEVESLGAGDRVATIDFSIKPVMNDAGQVLLLIPEGRDITARKEAEEALKNYAARLERLNRELQEFAFVASHDLQEPLRKIQAFGDLLNRKCKESLGEEGGDYLSRMTRAAKRMQELVTALLDYSRITTQGGPFKPIDLAKVIHETISDLDVAIERVGGQIEVKDLPMVQADEIQMRQLFQNLIGNSIKYCPNVRKPEIKIYGQVKDDACQVFIEDNCIGFDEQYIDRIFKPFQRLHSRSSEYEGTGMGLAICRKIVERHGGSITAQSAPGKGSTFIITLPIGTATRLP